MDGIAPGPHGRAPAKGGPRRPGVDLPSVSSGVKFVVIGLVLITAVTIDALARLRRMRTLGR